jgi:uncharacterized protein YbaP (TraB family)
MILKLLSGLFNAGLREGPRTLALAVALIWTVPANAAEQDAAQDHSGPAIWSIQNGASTVYLFGSVHLLKPETTWRTERLDSILEAADHLVLEVDLKTNTPATLQKFMAERGMYGPDRSLKDALPADLYAEVVTAAGNAGIPEPLLQRMRPWYASLVVSMSMIKSLGFDPAQGVEQKIMAEMAAHKARITGLETVEQQLSIFADQPEEVGVSMVRDALRQFKDISDLLNELTASWSTGDIEELERVLIGGFDPYPKLYQAIIVDRNKQWVPQITALTTEPGVHLVVVGTAHLIGDDSVIRMLTDQGVEITRDTFRED